MTTKIKLTTKPVVVVTFTNPAVKFCKPWAPDNISAKVGFLIKETDTGYYMSNHFDAPSEWYDIEFVPRELVTNVQILGEAKIEQDK